MGKGQGERIGNSCGDEKRWRNTVVYLKSSMTNGAVDITQW